MSDALSLSRFITVFGVTAVTFFLVLIPFELIPEIPVDIDMKPFFVPLALAALLPAGRTGLAIALGVAMGEGLRDLFEGYELDDPIGFFGYIAGFYAASVVFAMRPLNKVFLVGGAIVCGFVQAAIEATSLLLFGAEGLSVAVESALGNTLTHGVLWGAIPLLLLVPALNGRFEAFLGFEPRGTTPAPPLSAGTSRVDLIPPLAAGVRGLAFRPAGQEAPLLRDVSFKIAPGEAVGLFGPSGCGKTALSHVLAGLAPRATGGEAAGDIHPARQARVVGPDPATQMTQMKPHQELAAILMIRGLAPGAALEAAEKRLAAAGVLPRFVREEVWNLPAEMQARVVFTAALAAAPDLIVINGVAELLGDDLSGRLAAYRAGGGAVIVLSGDSAPLATLTTRCVLLEDGRIAREGPTATMLHDFASALGEAPETPAVRPLPAQAATGDAPLLSIEGIPARTGAERSDLILMRGDRIGLLVESEAEAVALVRMLAGLEKTEGLTVRVNGEALSSLDPGARSARLAALPHPPLYGFTERTVEKEIRSGPSARPDGREEAIRLLEVGPQLTRDPLRLSALKARQVQMAAALARGADALVIANPDAGLDEAQRRDLRGIIERVAAAGYGVALVGANQRGLDLLVAPPLPAGTEAIAV